MANPNPSPDTRFKPGQSGNPAGRPRTKPLTDRIRERLEEAGKDGRVVADVLVDDWLTMISGGDASALRELLNRIEGKVTDKLEHSGDLTIRVEYADIDADTPEAAPGPDADPPGGEAL